MKIINDILKPISEYLVLISRNTIDGWYEIEVGIPSNWVYQENEYITCEVKHVNDNGKLIKLSPKNNEVYIDDLISFVVIIIETNKRIAEKEQEFADQMEEFKSNLEKKAKNFYDELDLLKEKSFSDLNSKFKDKIKSNDPPKTPKITKTTQKSKKPVTTTKSTVKKPTTTKTTENKKVSEGKEDK